VRIAKLLTIHFLRRFFDHEMLGAGASPYASVVRTLSLLFLPGFLVAMYTYPLYVNIDFKWPHLLEPTRWSNKLLFCTIAASLMAFVTSLQWDALFPSRDDFMILTPLPLRRRMVFACKVAALGVFAAMFATAINIGPAIVFPSATVRPADPVWWVIGYAWTHGISLFLCSLFVFLFCLAVQGALLNLLPVRWYRRAAVVVQFLLMAASATLLLLFPLAAKLAPLGKPSPILQWFVPAWFAGLSEFWKGRQDPVFEMLAHNASLEQHSMAPPIRAICRRRLRLLKMTVALKVHSPGGWRESATACCSRISMSAECFTSSSRPYSAPPDTSYSWWAMPAWHAL
jgi:hypothetical protein